MKTNMILSLFLFVQFVFLPGASEAASISVLINWKASGTSNPHKALYNANVTLSNGTNSKSRASDIGGYADFGSLPDGIYKLSIYYPNAFYFEKNGLQIQGSKLLTFNLDLVDGPPDIPSTLPPPPPPKPAPILTGYDDKPVSVGVPFCIELYGSDFQRGARLEFSPNNGGNIYTTGLEYLSSTRVKVYGQAHMPAGKYLARILNFDGQRSGIIEINLRYQFGTGIMNAIFGIVIDDN